MINHLKKNIKMFSKKLYSTTAEYNDLLSRSDGFEEIKQNYISLLHKQHYIKTGKIKVLFVCHRPSVWTALKSVYETMLKDPVFNVEVIAIPNKKELPGLWLNHENYESEGAEEFWKNYNCINGFNYETKQWIDLRELNPDYVFFQQPYNITKFENYKSFNVSKFSELCYVPYFYSTNKKLAYECMPQDFMKDVKYFFLQNETENRWYTEYFNQFYNANSEMFVTGYPKFDGLVTYKTMESSLWKLPRNGSYRIIWTPRWTTNEGNCHFFKYRYNFEDLCKDNQKIDFVFRPHPQAFLEWNSTGEMLIAESNKMIRKYEESPNMTIDKNADYLPLFYSSDCLVTDLSSVVPEYLLTGKPIIYCKNKKTVNNIEGKITEGFYTVHDWNELHSTINQLMTGIDPLKKTREKLIAEELRYDPNYCSGEKITEIIKTKFLECINAQN